jgi:hypothetical protein
MSLDKPRPLSSVSGVDMLLKPTSDAGRRWDDYTLVKSSFDGSKFLRGYIDRFNTVSFFNEYAGILSYFFVLGQVLSPFMRIPIHGAHLCCRVHVFWIQQSRTGKSIAWEFTEKLLQACGVESEQFSAGSDAKLIGTVREVPQYDDEGKPTGQVEYETVPGILNGYKSLVFDEGSVLLNDSKAYFSDKILYLQQAMAPIGSATNVLVKHLVGGSVRTPSGVSLWMTTFPPKDIMHHVLEKGFFQRVFLFQNDVGIEQRQTVSEHRMSGVYIPVPDEVVSYDDLGEVITKIRDEVKERLLASASLTQEEWDALEEGEREDIAITHAHNIFTVGPGYHAAILNAVDDYYALVKGVSDQNIRETAMSFIPNVENYTVIFGNLIAATMGSSVITADHIMMATEVIYDNLHNLIIWLEQKQDYKASKQREYEQSAWKTAYNRCKRLVDKRSSKEAVRKSEIEEQYAVIQGVSVKTSRRRLDKMIEGGAIEKTKDGRLAYIRLNW